MKAAYTGVVPNRQPVSCRLGQLFSSLSNRAFRQAWQGLGVPPVMLRGSLQAWARRHLQAVQRQERKDFDLHMILSKIDSDFRVMR
jgi:hypothetical protein